MNINLLIQHPELLWFIVGMIMLVLEFVIPGLVIFFFGIGAWVVALLCLLFDIPLNIQLFIFILSSVVLLVVLRKWMTKFFRGFRNVTASKDNIDYDFGGKALVKQKITPTTGKVEYHGVMWNAESDEIIEEGETVNVVKKDNLTLRVKPIR